MTQLESTGVGGRSCGGWGGDGKVAFARWVMITAFENNKKQYKKRQQ